MTEQEMRQAFARLTEPVLPGADPYQQLMKRNRTRRLGRVAGWITAVAAVAIAALAGPVALQGAAGPGLNGGPSSGPSGGSDPGPYVAGPMTEWMRRLIDSPVRGGLATDTALLTDLTARLDERFSNILPGASAKILFAADVGSARVVMAIRSTQTEQLGITVVDHQGATAEQLAQAATEARQGGSSVMIDVSRPYAGAGFMDLVNGLGTGQVAIAPAGCAIETAVPPDLAWQPAATGDYLVRNDQDGDLWSRVTCDGAVRYLGPSWLGTSFIRVGNPTETQLDAAIGAMNCTDRELVRRALQMFGHSGPPVTDQRVRFCGFDPALGHNLVVATAVKPAGELAMSIGMPDGAGSELSNGVADEHFAFASSLPMPPDESSDDAVVILPAGTATLQLLGEDGAVRDSRPVSSGIVHLQPVPVTGSVRALDSAGSVIATSPLPASWQPGATAPNLSEMIEDWD